MNRFCGTTLTPREEQIVKLVAEGMTNAEIGAAIGITQMGVKNHVRRIFDKRGVWSRLELALWQVHRTESLRQ